MPNYVRNRLIVEKNAIKVFAFIKNEHTLMDFNKIVPMPDGLDICESTLGDEGAKYLFLKNFSFLKNESLILETKLKECGKFEEAIELGKKYLINIGNTGYKTWYGWAIDNWGTKWNALDAKQISGWNRRPAIEFDTAWSGVVSLMEKLSMLFPDILFNYEYADEDIGVNCGVGSIKNGISHMIDFANGSREAYELAFELYPEEIEYYHLENDVYVYKRGTK